MQFYSLLTLNQMPMKNQKPLLLFMLLIAITSSCKKEEIPGPAGQDKGRLSIEIGLFIQVSEIDNPLKSTQAVEDFRVEIYRTDDTEMLTFEKASDMPAQVELEAGDYYVAAHSNNRLQAAFDNPYYYGRSDNFTIAQNEDKSVVVNCVLANCMVTVVYSDNVKSSFTNHYAVVKAGSDSLVFSSAETRAGFFEPGSLSIRAILIYDNGGTTAVKVLTGTIDNAQARRHYEIRVDALPDNGSSAIQINLDETIASTEIISLQGNSTVPAGTIPPGGLIFSEIMANPDSLADNEGEWVEVYNTLSYAINLQNLVIRRDAANSHVIGESILLDPGHFYVLARTANAVAGTHYVYGSSITLTNTSAQLSISNYGTDGKDGSVIFSVTYGGTGFSVPTGASLSLNPLHMNATDAKSGSWWCPATSAYNTGDLGTPGMANDNCN
jgi:hypothetical protein